MSEIRTCRDADRSTILAIINAAAQAYRGVIPSDRWHEPYMGEEEFVGEVAAGVVFWGYQGEDGLLGVMGLQPMGDIDLIRHAYVLPENQRSGIGSALLQNLRRMSRCRMLVGTWAAADWAIRFYRRHGFVLVSPATKVTLLKTYWTVPDRQIESSVVFANPPLDEL